MIKNTFIPLVIFGLIVCFSSCDDGASEDCAGSFCSYVGNWRLIEVYLDGNEVEDDYSVYRLDLKSPADGEASGNYNRIFANGTQEAGTWEVTNNNDVIILHVYGEIETYIVESVSQSKLILILNRETNKVGTEQIRFVFEK